MEDFGRSIALDPEHADSVRSRADAYFKLGEYDKAVQDYDWLTSLRPGLETAHYRKGLALACLDQHDAAIRAYDRAIELAPDYTCAYNKRGMSLLALGDSRRAMCDFSRNPFFEYHMEAAYELLDDNGAERDAAALLAGLPCESSLGSDTTGLVRYLPCGPNKTELRTFRWVVSL